ncbi:MAG: hypothetical protein MJ252_30340 [archaeon]|nr:hypothetical protein [archaeon]
MNSLDNSSDSDSYDSEEKLKRLKEKEIKIKNGIDQLKQKFISRLNDPQNMKYSYVTMKDLCGLAFVHNSDLLILNAPPASQIEYFQKKNKSDALFMAENMIDEELKEKGEPFTEEERKKKIEEVSEALQMDHQIYMKAAGNGQLNMFLIKKMTPMENEGKMDSDLSKEKKKLSKTQEKSISTHNESAD